MKCKIKTIDTQIILLTKIMFRGVGFSITSGIGQTTCLSIAVSLSLKHGSTKSLVLSGKAWVIFLF